MIHEKIREHRIPLCLVYGMKLLTHFLWHKKTMRQWNFNALQRRVNPACDCFSSKSNAIPSAAAYRRLKFINDVHFCLRLNF